MCVCNKESMCVCVRACASVICVVCSTCTSTDTPFADKDSTVKQEHNITNLAMWLRTTVTQ